ncbi:MAG: hypothetical protein HQ474_11555 [Flammeovirgaceae bacterium]|nr:hypothetical protein [Flammeovirgaceae bacterium]
MIQLILLIVLFLASMTYLIYKIVGTRSHKNQPGCAKCGAVESSGLIGN